MSDCLAKSREIAQKVRVVVMTVAACALCFCYGAAISSCAARQHVADGVAAFLECESAGLPADTLGDATALATGALQKWISGSGAIDAAGLKGDLATLKTNLGRCAMAAAVVAWAGSSKPSAEAPMAAALAVDPDALRRAFVRARTEAGWPAVKIAGQTL